MKFGIFAAALVAMVASGAAVATPNLVTNGGFEINTGPGQLYNGYTTVADWDGHNGYNFLFTPGTLDTTGAHTPQYNSNLTLWGSHNGGVATLPATSPAHGDFIVADGAFLTAPLTQQINGLTSGQVYAVSFYWAAGQQHGFTGQTTEGWNVSLGGETHSTSILTNPSHDFQPWRKARLLFTATGVSETLSFLALGTPTGKPPFSLLDGVSATAVPEAATWAMLVAGFGLVGVAARRRRGVTVAA